MKNSFVCARNQRLNTMEQDIWVFVLAEPQWAQKRTKNYKTPAIARVAHTHTKSWASTLSCTSWIYNMCSVLNYEFKAEKFPYCAKARRLASPPERTRHAVEEEQMNERVVDSSIGSHHGVQVLLSKANLIELTLIQWIIARLMTLAQPCYRLIDSRLLPIFPPHHVLFAQSAHLKLKSP